MKSTDQQALIRALENPSVFPHATDGWKLIETHISWVILCGPYAYKIKKALDLGFLDFTTLDKREFYCAEELRLNSRLAPELYLSVISITGTEQRPQLGGPGDAIEYAVKMRRFPEHSLLGDMAEEGRLEKCHIDQIITQIAEFHLHIPAASSEVVYGDPEHVHAPAQENFEQILERIEEPQHIEWVTRLKDWTDLEYHRCYKQFEHRKQQGFVRECHGDMHLGNMAVIDEVPVIFDGIEFNPDLYWIDVMSEVAFLFMDLEDHGKRDFAYRTLNGYLEITGDYPGLRVLRYYLTYRAVVRAKIACIRETQFVQNGSGNRLRQEFESYLQLALGYTQPESPVLIITHGLSGSGKSTLSAPLAEHMGAVRIRSDYERQRLFGRGKREGEAATIQSGVYSPDATLQTYKALQSLAKEVLEAGYPVIIDATFLARPQRDLFRQLATSLSVPLRILFFHADVAVLKQRIKARQREGNDISEADVSVLQHQLQVYVGLDADEKSETVLIDTQSGCDSQQILALITQSLA